MPVSSTVFYPGDWRCACSIYVENNVSVGVEPTTGRWFCDSTCKPDTKQLMKLFLVQRGVHRWLCKVPSLPFGKINRQPLPALGDHCIRCELSRDIFAAERGRQNGAGIEAHASTRIRLGSHQHMPDEEPFDPGRRWVERLRGEEAKS